MKGLIFTEFFEMVESAFDADMVDTLIDNTNPPSLGAYTAVGSYDFAELANMVVELGRITGAAVPDLLTAFGKHLGVQFASKFPAFFAEAGGTIALLKQVDEHIHVEVRKLYPDAELPTFSYQEKGDVFELLYSSPRPLADVALGLIEQSSEHYGENFEINMNKWDENNKHYCTFTIKKAA